jgi:hypothetical protein
MGETSKERKKVLKEQYRTMKPDMGAFMIRCLENGRAYVAVAKDIRAGINGHLVRLENGIFVNRELQADRDRYGRDAFEVRVLETLPYDKDETKTDYTEELNILRLIWLERLAAGAPPYNL